jgi:RNA polymerase sigma factor (sigma-70 family)
VAVTVGEIELAYRHCGRRLQRFVAFAVRAPEVVVEDACQAAWCRLLDYRDDVDAGGAGAWVARTAIRDAMRSMRVGSCACSLESAADSPALRVAGPDERLELRQRLGVLSALPVRQQRLMWLRGIGFSYREMAVQEGCTPRTVERQLARAGLAVAEAQA